MQEILTKPYLLRALYEWCTDNGYTPHLAVRVDKRTRVPREFVCNGEIVLNISFEATNQLQMGNDLIEFHARFAGRSYKIEVPVDNVLAIYARENGQGMAFPVEDRTATAAASEPAAPTSQTDGNKQGKPAPSKTESDHDKNSGGKQKAGRKHLKVIK